MLKKHTKLLRVLLLALLLTIVDQATKIIVYFYLVDDTLIHLTSFCDILIIWNYGISFGLFNNATANQDFIILICLSVIIYMIYDVLHHKCQPNGPKYTYLPYDLLSYAIIIGGAVGNIVDRIRYGAVLDFIYLHIGPYYWPAFNVADILIVFGAMLFLYQSLKKETSKQ